MDRANPIIMRPKELRTMQVAKRRAAQADNRAMRELLRLANSQPPQPRSGEPPAVTVEGAIIDMGLANAHVKTATKLIQQVVDDTMSMMDAAMQANDAGIPRHQVSRMLRAANQIRARKDMNKSSLRKSSVPIGTIHEWKNGERYQKTASGWKPVEGGKGGGKGEDPKSGKKGKSDDGGDERGSVKDRFKDLKARAKKHGVKIKGKLHDEHTHDHLDALERKIADHVSGKFGGGKEQQGKAPKAGEEGPDQDVSDAGQGDDARDTSTQGHDVPDGHHEIHALKMQVADLQNQLDEIKNHLSSQHEEGMHADLKKEGEKIKRDPSPQAISHYQGRIKAFIAFVTGAAMLAAGGSPADAATAGGLEAAGTRVPQQGPTRFDDGEVSGDKKEKKKGAAKKTMKEGIQQEIDENVRQPREAKKSQTADEAVVNSKIRDLIGEGYERDQAVAIALDMERKGKLKKSRRKKPPRKSKIGITKGQRARHPKNEFGHRDGLQPGMKLTPRSTHADVGSVEVLDHGRFRVGDEVVKGGHALLTRLYGHSDHRQTVRRYFHLGGERKDPIGALRKSLKPHGVLVQRFGGEYVLTGDLADAGIPEHMIDNRTPNVTRIDRAAADALKNYLGGEQ